MANKSLVPPVLVTDKGRTGDKDHRPPKLLLERVLVPTDQVQKIAKAGFDILKSLTTADQCVNLPNSLESLHHTAQHITVHPELSLFRAYLGLNFCNLCNFSLDPVAGSQRRLVHSSELDSKELLVPVHGLSSLSPDHQLCMLAKLKPFQAILDPFPQAGRSAPHEP